MVALWQDSGTLIRHLVFFLFRVPVLSSLWLFMKLVPGMRKSMAKRTSWVLDGTSIASEDLATSMGTFVFLKRFLHKSYINTCLKEARSGQNAPNATVTSLDGQSMMSLLGLQKKSRPLVLSFGSCT